jgi:glycosyltransferase involved in cell wall biosynthesis
MVAAQSIAPLGPPRAGRTRVLVDATSIPPNLGGVGRYLQFLIPALAELDDVELVVVAQQRDVPWLSERAPAAHLVPLPARWARRGMRLIWEQVDLPRLARRFEANVIHSPHYTMPILTRVPVVVTLHDATFFSHPRLHTPLKRAFFRFWTRWSARHARLCVVPSAATAHEEERYVRLSPNRAVVAHHGVDDALFRPPTPAQVAAFADTHDFAANGWIGFLGTIEPRKNLANLVRAYSELATRSSTVPTLAIAGARGWDHETKELIAELPASVDVRMLGYLPGNELSAFLGGATVVAYPSLGEGFGLPVVEAMACGAPTLTTRELALPEVGGDAVAYCGTTPAEIRDALHELLGNGVLRESLAAAGLARAASFTWQASARIHRTAFAAAAIS